MKKFIGRKKELQILKENLFSDKSALTVLLGRRGVGKTSLLNYFEDLYVKEMEKCFYFNFVGNNKINKKEQMINFLLEITSKLSISKKETNIFLKELNSKTTNWKMVLNFFYEKLEEKRIELNNDFKVYIAIDEFAWFNTKESGFVEYFGEFWNKINFKYNIFCVLSGSTISWMNKNVLKAKGSLYHKTTEVIKLKAFNYEEVLEYFHFFNIDLPLKIINQYYFVTGGVARYLDKIKINLNLEENMEKIFNEMINGDEKEFDNLFNSTFNLQKNKKDLVHKEIILLYKDCNKILTKDIVNKLKEKYSIATIYSALNDLEVSDIIRKVENIRNKNENVYMLIDFFCFYNVKFFYKNNVINILDNESLDKYNGYAFEIMAFLNTDIIKKEISRNGFKTKEYKFQNENAQIDMIIDYGNNKYSLVECKYYNNPLSIDKKFEEDILNKKQQFINYLLEVKRIKKYQIDVILFTLNGININKKGSINYLDVNLANLQY